MADAGIDDILISYNLIGEEKMSRLGALQAKAHVTVAADNPTVIAGLTQAAAVPAARSRSWSNAIPDESAPASKRPPRRSRSRGRSPLRRA